MPENFPDLLKNSSLHIQKAYPTLNRINTKRSNHRYTIGKILIDKDKKKDSSPTRKQQASLFRNNGNLNGGKTEFSEEKKKTATQESNIHKNHFF